MGIESIVAEWRRAVEWSWRCVVWLAPRAYCDRTRLLQPLARDLTAATCSDLIGSACFGESTCNAIGITEQDVILQLTWAHFEYTLCVAHGFGTVAFE
jgi:hypothetical protein